ncbi:1,4-dihydroxy-2-naphthoate polyprenyltransferase [Savagea faecisuis]|uniref:1,4-dihydroxy-2-naphthoate octaprenyltransferase n=1 Tax=Savagea faecisuis TaxID=1274803 RepID=A0ABW3GTT2_9BACL
MHEQLQKDEGWRIWWKLTRPHTLTASFAPVFLGTMIALRDGHFHTGLFIAMLIASLLIQSATNMFNEYYDFKLGLDNEKSIGIGGTIVRNGIQPKTVLQLALAFYAIAFLIGIYIIVQTSWWLAVVGIVSMAIGYFYTGGPFPIAYTPFGEVVSGFVMGMLLVLISYFIQTGEVTTDAILLSVPSMFLVANIMLANNIRDIVQDTKGGRKTMAILIGRENAVRVYATLFALSYIWVIALVLSQHVTPWALIVLLTIPKPIKAVRTFKQSENPLEVMPAMKNTGVTNTLFATSLGLALLIQFALS